jgi:hypothetical protein
MLNLRSRNVSRTVPKPKDDLRRPGFGLPLDELRPNEFPTFFNRNEGAITVRELSMLKFMDSITDKPGWRKKVFDKTIVKKWRVEASHTLAQWSEKAFDEVSSKPSPH